MKTLKFTAYLFYRYYSTGATKQIPYLSTLCALVLLTYIHLCQVLILINRMNLVPTNGSQAQIGNWLRMAFFLLPFFLVFYLLINEKDLIGASYQKEKIRTGYIFLFSYIILSVAALILLILYKRRGY